MAWSIFPTWSIWVLKFKKLSFLLQISFGGTWRIILLNKWLITLVSTSPKDRATFPFQMAELHGLKKWGARSDHHVSVPSLGPDPPSRSRYNFHDAYIKGILAAPPKATPPRNKGLIAGLIKGNQWLINP